MNRREFLIAGSAAGAGLFYAAALAAPGKEEIPMTGKNEPHLSGFDELMRSFMAEHNVPGAALAVGRKGKIVYARGFGFADVEKKQTVEPNSLFRIASLSKSLTGAAIVQLHERGKLRLDQPAFKLAGERPWLETGAKVDERIWKITVEQLLHHTGGFDRGVSFDPMFRSIEIARVTQTPAPAEPRAIIQYMMGRPLDFDPGTKEAYSNFGYCVLGRIIEKLSGVSDYTTYVQQEILKPLGVHRMKRGRTLLNGRAEGEVRYYPKNDEPVKSVFKEGKLVPPAYGGWYLEAMDSHGGWIASAPDLVRFASSFDDPDRCPFLNRESVETLFRRPRDTGFTADGKPKDAYYACGWMVRPVGTSGMNTWHNGLLDGTSTLLVRRSDGVTWAVLFNRDYAANGKHLGGIIDPLLHPVASAVKNWPEGDDFSE